jgi:Tfp pilus assembly protein PilO
MKLSELSQSEKRLMGIVAVLVAVLLNIVVFQFFVKTRRQLDAQLEQKSALAVSLRELETTSPMWEQRTQWLQKVQPKLGSEQAEGNALLTFLKESASKHGLTLAKQQLVSAKTEGGITAVPVQFEFKGPWRGVCAFFAELQAPDRFVVVQQSRLRVDPSDATLMLCDCTVAKWFVAR